MSFNTDEFLTGYLLEAEEHIKASNNNLLAVETAIGRKAQDPKAVRELFRSLHTLKGLSGMIGADPIVDIAHEMESVLRLADRAGGRLTGPTVDALFAGIKAIEERVNALQRRTLVAPAPPALLAKLSNLEVGSAAPALAKASLQLEPELAAKLSDGELAEITQGIADGKRALRIDFVPSLERAAAGDTITAVRARVTEVGTLVKVLPRPNLGTDGKPSGVAFVLLVLTSGAVADLAKAAHCDVDAVVELVPHNFREQASEVPEPELVAEPADSGRPQTVRVDVERLDEALDGLAALVVGRSRFEREVSRLADAGADTTAMRILLREHTVLLRNLRSAIMRARMISVSELLERAPLIIRGLCKNSGKSVTLDINAGQAQLDKSVAERLMPVIVHLLRNAVDHAVESEQDRIAAGKSPEATIAITCLERGGQELELSFADDGRGINAADVAKRAAVPVPSSPSELLALLVKPGFSTASEVTHTSGRGLGMEIIQRIVVDELGGTFTVETVPGQGTKFTIRVAVSLTILDGFTFTSGDSTFVVPASAVTDLTEVDPGDVTQTPLVDPRHLPSRLFRHRGQDVPLIALGRLLGTDSRTPSETKNGVVGRSKAIVVETKNRLIAFSVDRLLARQEIVVRPVADRLARVPGVSGTTDLGDGSPTLVLDLVGLWQHHQQDWTAP